MPPESPKEQEIMLKKRARRRLVGAMALVLLMIIVLPQILEDRATLVQQEPIKITMADAVVSQQAANQNATLEANPSQNSQSESITNLNNQTIESGPALKAELPAQTAEEARVSTEVKVPAEIVKKTNASESANKAVTNQDNPAVKSADSVKRSVNTSEMFTVQIGVYSDASNVKRLQDQLKRAGFDAYTEKIKTSKGESIRLKAGRFISREDAVEALGRMKTAGLSSGMVVAE